MIGQTLGPYRVLEKLGEGGMGQVYAATDTRLGRAVAIKLLPESFARNEDRVARFAREARLLASLNHPNIAVVYGFESVDACTFLVMELVDGPTLADVVAERGSGLPIDNVLMLASQIVDGLEAAHDKGVIHRDLKPSNIKVTHDGRVKLLDFGLAKALTDGTGSGQPGEAGGVGTAAISQSPTALSPTMTQAGIVLGTAGYMSPEQAKGTDVDRRTDVFSFGCVLYEMLTGRRAFEGDSSPEVLARVIEREANLGRLPASTPPALERLLRRCLTKDRSRRLQHIGDARLELDDARSEPAQQTGTGDRRGRGRERAGWIVAAAMSLALAAAIAVPYVRAPAPQPEMRVEIPTPAALDPYSFAVSPDGRTIAFVASAGGQPRLFLRGLGQGEPTALPGTEGALYPFWSPDNRSLGFFAGAEIKRIDLAGGTPRSLARAVPGGGGSWGPDGEILFAPTLASALFRVNASGGEATAVTSIDGGQMFGHRFPQFLPGGRHFLFYAFGDQAIRGIYLGSLDDPAAIRRITPADGAAWYIEPGWLLYPQQGTLLAQRFNIAGGELTGDPVVVAERISTNDASARVFSAGAGIIAYAAPDTPSRLVWFDRSGQEIGSAGTADDTDVLGPEISPDGTRIAVTRARQNNQDIWIFDRGRSTRMTLDPAIDRFPVWSPDGSQLLFQSDRTGSPDLYLASSTAPGRERPVLVSPEREFPSDWAPDGQSALTFVVGGSSGLTTALDLLVLPLMAPDKRYPWLDGPATELWGQFSPDGTLVVYYSNESGDQEVYVRRFAMPDERWLVSSGGGVYPRWSGDGTEIYYIAPDSSVMAVPIAMKNGDLVAGAAQPLFRPRIVGGGVNRIGRRHEYDVAADGRFLVNVEAGSATSSSITLLLNWTPE